MTTTYNSDLASLDHSLAIPRESLVTLRAAKPVNLADVTEQLKRAANSASIVRELVWSELPDASWQSREELDELMAEIQKIFDARHLKQMRSRLLAMATELERGTIVHRRAHRLDELNQMRDQAVNELRSEAGLEGLPQTLPGPQPGEWLDWACGLREPQDAEPLQALRDGFPHLDDFVANLEPTMWVPGAPVLVAAPEPERSAGRKPTGPFQVPKRGVDDPFVASEPHPAAKEGFDPRYVRVVDSRLMEKQPVKRTLEMAASREVPAVQSDAPALVLTLASLDGSLDVLGESLDKLEAAQSVSIAEVVERLKRTADYARLVRESVGAELPDASWQSREELNALVAEIKKIFDARILQQRRSCLLALATELEQGSIVHRRAHRLNELNQLRDQAINELRSQAGSGGTPQPLPGPQANQWIAWADTLKEPEDSEALQAIRNGFPLLDDFIANLEPNLWVPAAPPAPEIPPEPEKTPPEPLRMARKRDEGAVVPSVPIQRGVQEAKFEEVHDEPPVPDLPKQPAAAVIAFSTPTPREVTPPRSGAESAPAAGMLGRVSKAVGQFGASRKRAPAEEVLRETGPAATVYVRDGAAAVMARVEPPPAEEIPRETKAAPLAPVREEVAQVKARVERPAAEEVRRERAAREDTADAGTEVAEPWSAKWQKAIASPAALAAAAVLLLFAVLGAMLWGAHKNHYSIPTVKAVESKVPDQTQSNPTSNAPGQAIMSTDLAAQASSPTAQTSNPKAAVTEPPKPQTQSPAPNPKDQNAAAKAKDAAPKPKEQSLAANLLTKFPPPKQADNAALSPPPAAPNNAVVAKKEEAPPKVAAATPAASAPNSGADIVKNIPVAVSTTNERPGAAAPATTERAAAATPTTTEAPPAPAPTPKEVRVSSGVAQGLLVQQVSPRYPLLAKQTRVEGTVVLQAVIGKNGSVKNVKAVSGNPLLVPAAIDAVKLWRYKPYQLDGEPVEANTQINVKFSLPPE